ncbi:hypothetical protein E4U58_000796 [Claviceps cyperi]|nr:hypothetical protein E4U58_000796 [Claviceps cyperi]
MALEFNLTGGRDAFLDLSFDHQHQDPTAYGYSVASLAHSSPLADPGIMANPRAWALPLEMASTIAQAAASISSSDDLRGSSPLSHTSSPHSHYSTMQQFSVSHAANPLVDWTFGHHQPRPIADSTLEQQLQLQQQQQQQQQQQEQEQQLQQQQQHLYQQQQQEAVAQQHMTAPEVAHFIQDSALASFGTFPHFHHNALDYLSPTTQAALQANLMDSPFPNIAAMGETAQTMHWGNNGMETWHDFQNTLQMDALTRIDSTGSGSPNGTYLEVLSLPSSNGDGWAMVDWSQQGLDHFQQAQSAAIFNPGQTLHLRTHSDSSDAANSMEFGFEEVHLPYSPHSSGSDSHAEYRPNMCQHRTGFTTDGHNHSHETASHAVSAPMPIKAEPASVRHRPGSGGAASGSLTTAANARRQSGGPRKGQITKGTIKTIIRRTSNGKKDGTIEKKVGRRKGPLLPEQRKQASEIRKLRACLRCKFLKKTCDKGEPCAGCQPSHARLWQVPCTRVDIKDLWWFMKDWKADYEIHGGLGMSVYNVKGFSSKESLMWITHGYGFALPVMVREVFVADEGCFAVEWVEAGSSSNDPISFETKTEKLDVGAEGVRLDALQEYLDKHVEGPFEDFINDHFEGTPFITEILKTAHRYYMKDRMPIIKKALKLVLAYNLTMHITMIESQGPEANINGQIDDEDSKFFGRTVAPVMINFQIKCALAEMWRELQKNILEELSSLYSGVYSGDKMKNWPTIFLLASILLAVWEEMQFDCHYRVPDPLAVDRFCFEMEDTPVGVIVGLFHAISQKLPALADWDTRQHGQLLHNNASVCDALTEVRESVIKHDSYLRTRKETTFDPYNFDSLSNKFLSKLVIK